MRAPVNFDAFDKKLHSGAPLSIDEQRQLLSQAQALLASHAYLASCQAATLEGLPKSTSKSERARHVRLCRLAASGLMGDTSAFPGTERPVDAIERCNDAADVYASVPATTAVARS